MLNAKSNLTQADLLEDLMLYIAKGYCLLSYVENPWLKCLIVHQCEWVQRKLGRIMFSQLLLSYITCIAFFHLWITH
jgi:hypothetical protein